MTWGDYVSMKARAEAAEAALREATDRNLAALKSLSLALSALHEVETQVDYVIAQVGYPVEQEAAR